MQTQIDPVEILRTEFTRRSQRNDRYSLRAFAKSLGLSPTVVSLVMSGQRPLSRRSATIVAERLELSPAQAAGLLARSSRKPTPHRNAAAYEYMDLETFETISDWVHYAILSLLEISTSRFESKWIAKRLGINELQAKLAMDRLVSVGLVAEVKGRWRQTGKPIKIENSVSNNVTRKFHRQFLEKALASLDIDPAEKRDFSSMTMAIDPAEIPYARERIRQFRRELTGELEGRAPGKEVYNLTVQIYPISKEEIK